MGATTRFATLLVAIAGSSALTYYLMIKQMKAKEKKLRQYEKALQKYGGQKKSSKDDSADSDNEDGLIAGIVLQLWKQSIQPAASATVLASLEPILKDSLPESGPLSKLKVVKCDLGSSPIHIKNTIVHEVGAEGCCQFDMDILWDGDCEIQFAGPIGKFGIRALKLFGRMSFQMRPLTDVLPCFGGLSYTFLNPPHLSLEFTGLASVAEFSFLEEKIQSTIQDAINNMLVLPYRMYYKMDDKCPLMDMYPPPLGILRVTIPASNGFVIEKRLIGKDDVPDCYCKVQLGNRLLQTSTRKDNLKPSWANEPMDFVLSDYDQILDIHCWDQDKGPVDPDDDLGACSITIRELLMTKNRSQELSLTIEHDDGTTTLTDAKLMITCEMIPLVNTYSPITNYSQTQKPYLLNGFLSILVTQAFDIPLEAKDAMTFVHVESSDGKQSFDTGMVKEGPGVDPLNPIFDCNFDIPLGIDETPDITLTLYQVNKIDPEKMIPLGAVTLKWADMIAQPDLRAVTQLDENDGDGASLEYGIYLRGATVKDLTPPPSPSVAESPPSSSATEDRSLLRGSAVDNAVSSESNSSDTTTVTPKLKATKTSIPLRASTTDSQSIIESIRSSESGELSPPRGGGGATVTAAANTKKVQIIAVRGRGFKIRKKGPFRKKDIPDVYLKVQVAGSAVWQTSVIKDSITPEWNESKIFAYGGDKNNNNNNKVVVSGWDKNKGKLDKDDYWGVAETTVDKLLLAGGSITEVELIDKKGKATGLFISLQASMQD